MSERSTEILGISRRRLIQAGAGSLVLSLSPFQIARGAQLLDLRMWPARDYTRLTLEHDEPLKVSHFVIREGQLRLVVDIEGLELNARLQELVGRINPSDPYVVSLRAGQYQPRVVRLVMELKEDVQPQVFSLAPVGPYGHRLVFDLYPARPADPLMALLQKPEVEDDDPIGRAIAEAERNAQRDRPPRSEPKGPRMARLVTIAIDPGHGGEDPGAVGRAGTYEKHVTLSIAKRLHAMLDAQPSMRAALTRDGDYFVPLNQRVARARAVKADLLVSIHADAWIKPDARGSSVFALSERGATSSAAAWMAKRENDADLIGGVNLGTHDKQLARVLLDLSTTAQINDSLKFGASVLRELERINELHKPRVEQAGFAVLKAPDIPSILVETAFISNPQEEARLRDNNYQDEMARAIMKGIQRYFAKNPPLARNRTA
ncbi:MAG: N-acetylmuramoyl-L-alanine amidase [Burkholderiaceae bacterium]